MILILKLLLTPLLIALATLAGRRWGPAASGWFIGFPLTSGPVSVILALQHGPAFAARAAVGNLAGLASISVFCLAYVQAAGKLGPLGSLASGVAAYLAATALWNLFPLALWPTTLAALAVNAAVMAMIPGRSSAVPSAPAHRWDLPARMAIAMVFVFTLTSAASVMGPQLSGLLTPFPIFGSILAVFTHRQQGAAAAASFLRGHIVSLFGFAAFFVAAGSLLLLMPAWGAYGIAALAALAVNGITLRVM